GRPVPVQKFRNCARQLMQAQMWKIDSQPSDQIQVVRRQLPAAKHDLTKAHRHSVVLDNPSLRYRDSEKMSSGIFKMAKLQLPSFQVGKWILVILARSRPCSHASRS